MSVEQKIKFEIDKAVNLRSILKQTALSIGQIIPDKMYLSCRYWFMFQRRLCWNNPQRYTEKIQWLKIYDRRPQYPAMVDKYQAKRIVADKIGVEHIIPTLKVWKCDDEIDISKLPDKFVLKCTHDSGVFICHDKSDYDINAVKRKIKKD